MASVTRMSYVLGWVFAVVAVLSKGLAATGVEAVHKLPASPRGILFFACFLFLATVATAAYEQAHGSGAKGRGTAA